MAPMHAGLGILKSGFIGHTRGQARHPRLGFLSGRLSRTVLAEFGGSTRALLASYSDSGAGPGRSGIAAR